MLFALVYKTRDGGFICIEKGEPFSFVQVVIKVLEEKIIRGRRHLGRGYWFLPYFHNGMPFLRGTEIPSFTGFGLCLEPATIFIRNSGFCITNFVSWTDAKKKDPHYYSKSLQNSRLTPGGVNRKIM